MKHAVLYVIRPFIILQSFFQSQLGLDPFRFINGLKEIPSFVKDLVAFRKKYLGVLSLQPCLHDRHDEGSSALGEYFYQDLLVARWIFMDRPQKHVDVASIIDGFVAHVASFREIEVFDIRPITANIPGVKFIKADLMGSLESLSREREYCDSLSCLHAIEHFGLGRYGDTVDPEGYVKGIANMAALLKPKGKFYLSTPIGQEQVVFNANYIFDPRTIIRIAKDNGLSLKELTVISSCGEIVPIELTEDKLVELAESRYNLGVFIFHKS